MDKETHQSGHILDLILTNNESMVENFRTIGKLGSSDHEMLMVNLNLGVVREETKKSVKDYRRGEYEEMRKLVSIDWKKELAGKDAEGMWNVIQGSINDAVEKCVPEKNL